MFNRNVHNKYTIDNITGLSESLRLRRHGTHGIKIPLL